MKSSFCWWKHGVVYQIYPRSFYDSNGDGIGDIPGIIQKLDYIESLGVDGVWLSPINTSPMFDFGYDISDYRSIDPVFGTLDDFDELLEKAHGKNIRIIMDLVINHTSHLHHWFVESRRDRTNPYRDFYIWQDPAPGGKPPNKWPAAFGGSAWELDIQTGQYYLHSFLKEQPDLNWRNPEVVKAVFGDIAFWLDRGVDGFRLDVINMIIKDDKFRNNPFKIGARPRPYDMQHHVYDRNRPESHDIIREFRKLLDSYNERMSVGEIDAEVPGDPEAAASYLGNGEDELHLAFDFSLIHTPWSARKFGKAAERWYKAVAARGSGKGWPCFVLSNHDQIRGISRYAGRKYKLERAKTAAVFLLTQRGTPFLYYGEEIGMENGKVLRDRIIDPVGKKYWPFHPGRDGERLPMQWSSGPNGGFSASKEAEPWLPLHPASGLVNVENQEAQSCSLPGFYRELLALRRKHPALHMGGINFLERGENGVISYVREHDGERLFIALNFTGKSREVRFPEADAGADAGAEVLLSTSDTGPPEKGGTKMVSSPLMVEQNESIILKLS